MPGADETLPAESADLGATVAAPVVSRGADFTDLRPIDPANYVVGKEIARGGMGRILMARDRRLGRDVAIKELLVESSGMRVRFEREARITARLQHPSIVNVLEAGAWPSGEPFYVMRLVTGQSLDQAVAAKATLRERLALVPTVIAAVDALAYAHANRIIHRDLKPSNVLVGAFGETVVIDWGLAKDLEDASSEDGLHSDEHTAQGETVAGSVLGTPSYMPPEQALGEPVTEAADVYSLGALLYHVLAGAPPYVGRASYEIIAAVTSGPPVALGTRVADVPPDLLAIVERAMAYEAKDRYASAGELALDLKRFQTGQLVGAHVYTTRQLIGRWIRRHRGAVAVAVAALVVIATVGVVSIRSLLVERAATRQARAESEDLTSYMLGDLHDKLQPLGKLDLLDGIAHKAVAYYAGRPVLTPEQRRKQSEANIALGDVLLFQGQREEALRVYTDALAVTETLDREIPNDPKTQTELRWCHQRMWSGFWWKGDNVEALREARALLLVDEAATRARPDDVQAITNTASTHSMIAMSLQALGKWPEAMLEYEESRRELEAMLKRAPAEATIVRTGDGVARASTHWKHELATMERNIGDLA
ncbi:MAG TPA: serine/threonine-protein kinase, partial [Kofleriaceae bacterium]